MSDDLTIEIVTETVPCGHSVTTIYRNAAGEIVRQDCEIRVTEPPKLLAATGSVS